MTLLAPEAAAPAIAGHRDLAQVCFGSFNFTTFTDCTVQLATGPAPEQAQ